jgi:hypothetical protein
MPLRIKDKTNPARKCSAKQVARRCVLITVDVLFIERAIRAFPFDKAIPLSAGNGSRGEYLFRSLQCVAGYPDQRGIDCGQFLGTDAAGFAICHYCRCRNAGADDVFGAI